MTTDTAQALRERFEAAKRNQTSRNHAEVVYWRDQWRLLAEDCIAALAAGQPVAGGEFACPFCGNAGDSDPRQTFGFNGPDRADVVITCGNCGARGPWVRYRETKGYDLAACETEALDRWKKRAALTDRAARQAAPSGWKLVPVEPTPAMVKAGARCASSNMCWREMLNAARPIADKKGPG